MSKVSMKLMDFAYAPKKEGSGHASVCYTTNYPREKFLKCETFYVSGDLFNALRSLKVGSSFDAEVNTWPEQRGKNMVYVDHLQSIYPKGE